MISANVLKPCRPYSEFVGKFSLVCLTNENISDRNSLKHHTENILYRQAGRGHPSLLYISLHVSEHLSGLDNRMV